MSCLSVSEDANLAVEVYLTEEGLENIKEVSHP